MRRFALLACLVLLASRAWAVDGDPCAPQSILGFGQPFACTKVCDGKGNSNPLTCGPVAINPNATSTLFFIEQDGGCNYDDVAVGLSFTTATSGIATKVLVLLDNDTVTNGITGVSMVVWPYHTLPYAYVSAGVLATCSGTFSIYAYQYK